MYIYLGQKSKSKPLDRFIKISQHLNNPHNKTRYTIMINFLQLIEKVSDFFEKKNLDIKKQIFNLGNAVVYVEEIVNSNQSESIVAEEIDDTTLKNILTEIIDRINSIIIKVNTNILYLGLI